jgi:hypothetical protein
MYKSSLKFLGYFRNVETPMGKITILPPLCMVVRCGSYFTGITRITAF